LNYLLELDRLQNRYFAMRHGHSMANQAGLIVSHPQNGCAKYGLSELGRAQVIQALQQDVHLDHETLIVSSDFKRAAESARIASEHLACKIPLRFEERLRERYFGRLELKADRDYQVVWREDAVNPDSEFDGVESANRVMKRVTSLILDLETMHSDQNILLVSHGDALQLLQTAFHKLDASRHRSLVHLETAEIRLLQFA